MSFCCASHFVVFPLYFLSQSFIFVHLGSTAYFDIVMSHNAGPVENVNTKLEKIEEKLEKRETELEEAKQELKKKKEDPEAKIGVAKAEIAVAEAKIEKAKADGVDENSIHFQALVKYYAGLVDGAFLSSLR